METVRGEIIDGWNMSITQIFGIGPKFTIRCGKCGHIFYKRLPTVNYPTTVCGACGSLNKFDVVWDK